MVDKSLMSLEDDNNITQEEFKERPQQPVFLNSKKVKSKLAY